MKPDGKLRSIALVSSAAVLFLILVSSTASASITETRISKDGGTPPCIYSNTLVWSNGIMGVMVISTFMTSPVGKKLKSPPVVIQMNMLSMVKK